MSVYERLGVRPVINATCHHTLYGGTVMWPEVIEAMAAARPHCVDMRQLLDRASDIITRYTRAEAAHVVSGCAAGLQVGAAAILTGGDPVRMEALPHTTGLMKNEFIAHRFPRRCDSAGRDYIHWGYAHAVRGAGGTFVEAGDDQGVTRQQFEAAFSPNTAGIYWESDSLDPGIQLPEVIAVAHERGVPVLIDASNTLPPAEHLHSFIDDGADLVAFSGGKGLRGPQGSGILTGRGDLIAAARVQSAPIQGIGRPMKVSKEEIVGLLTALEIWAARDHDADMRAARRRTDLVVEGLAGIPGVRAEHRCPDRIGRPYPTAVIDLDPGLDTTAPDLIATLLAGDPSIAVMPGAVPFSVRADVRILPDEEALLVAERLRHVLGELANR